MKGKSINKGNGERHYGHSIKKQFLESTFVRKYWDARVFGNTFLEEGANKGFIKTGVVQFGVGTSISPD